MSRVRDELPSRFRPQFLDNLDGRTQTAKVLRERLSALESDLGGSEALSYQQRSLARRCIWLESWLETMEYRAAEGEEVNIGQQVQAMNSLIGLFRALGIERRAREVPTLKDYVTRKGGGA